MNCIAVFAIFAVAFSVATSFPVQAQAPAANSKLVNSAGNIDNQGPATANMATIGAHGTVNIGQSASNTPNQAASNAEKQAVNAADKAAIAENQAVRAAAVASQGPPNTASGYYPAE